MRLGVQLPEVERAIGWDEVAAIARAAEDVGFDSIWVGDHLLYRDPDRGPWEAFTQLAALAAITERVTLGPLVACLAFHPPLVIAKMAATIQAVSGGRLVLGVGAGWNDEEFEAAGLPTNRKVSRFAVALAELVEHLASAPNPVDVPRIPLMSGSRGPRALAAALPVCDSWNSWFAEYGNTAEGFAAQAERCVGDADVELSACVLVSVDGGAGERPADPPPIPHTELRKHLRALEDAGAHEAILVLDPITEASVRAVASAAGRD